MSRLPIWGAMPQLLGEKMRRLRLQHQITQQELAQKLGDVSQSHIANIEASKDPASLSLVVRIAQFLNASTDYLLRDTIPVAASTLPLPGSTPDEAMVSFGARLRALRLQQQLSQRDLARTLGLASRAYIGGLEADRGKLPSLGLAVRLADLFGVTTDDLLRGVMPASASSADPGDA
jgi:transcriptional regulator with XRE-family HTH domain